MGVVKFHPKQIPFLDVVSCGCMAEEASFKHFPATEILLPVRVRPEKWVLPIFTPYPALIV